MNTPAVTPPSDPGATARLSLRNAWAFAAGYVTLYIAADWISYVHPLASLGITPWNPPPALSLALLLMAGLRFAPALFPAALLAEIFVHDAPALIGVQLASAMALSAGYAGAAWLLAGPLRFNPNLERRRDLIMLVAVAVAAALVVGMLYVAAHAAGGMIGSGEFGLAVLRFWIGDAIGILVVAPLLLVWVRADAWRGFRRACFSAESWAQAAAVALTLWLVFGLDVTDEFKFFYLFFLPIIWIAMRHGLPGVTLALLVVQLGLIFFTQLGNHPAITVLELQALMLALTVTGLFLGVTVGERQQALAELQKSLRLAAAGEMAAALAHELNQPLTALTSYGHACKLLSAAGAERRDDLERALDEMVAEASRAGQIVRRLRDFLRGGATHLAPVSPLRLLDKAKSALAAQAEKTRTTIRVVAKPGLPTVFVDELEMEIVLRNLVVNALDAAASTSSDSRTVEIRVEPEANGFLRFSVLDTGPGVTAEIAERLFEPFSTTKTTGMGMGLAISRAIVEAHGGTLWTEQTAHGAFHFTLPIMKDEEHGDQSR